jgi:ribonuclease BN (tRNA processing enzyme)
MVSPVLTSASLVFVGTGEALDPELPNTSLLVRGPQTLLLDCGYAVPHALWRITRDVDLLDAVWISHVHADHVFGLPALLLWMRLGGRTRPLTLLCGPGRRAEIDRVLELGYPGSFAAHKCYPIERVELDPATPGRFGEFTLSIAASAHSVPNAALRLDAPGLRSLVYSGDGAVTPGTRALCHGASVLVHECFFAESGSRKHGNVDSCVELARAAGVETLALLHFASEAKSAIREHARAACGEGLELCLPAPGDRLSLVEPARA